MEIQRQRGAAWSDDRSERAVASAFRLALGMAALYAAGFGLALLFSGCAGLFTGDAGDPRSKLNCPAAPLEAKWSAETNRCQEWNPATKAWGGFKNNGCCPSAERPVEVPE